MSVTAAQGFRASGVAAGLKSSGAPDLAVVVNDGPGHMAAGVFTSNRVSAAPVRWSRAVVADGIVHAVVLNSGGANACTGPEGYADTAGTAEHASRLLGVAASDVAVCSTGLIGVRLPMDRVLGGVDEAVAALSADGGADAAAAIMTTDTVAKQAEVSAAGFTVGGMAKGAGMLAPGLATMLVVLTTDAEVAAPVLQDCLRRAVSRTFDRVDSDGCMSTNDTVLLLANGASGVRPDVGGFEDAVVEVCRSLALALVADAEGASKQIEVEVTHAASEQDALDVARAVARSNLVKCAVHGEDPNWGRILAAVGTTAAAFDPDRLGVAVNRTWLAGDGAALPGQPTVDMSGREVHLLVDLSAGAASASVWTNDLTADYVHENSAYST